MSCLARPRPGAEGLADPRRGLCLEADVVRERLAVRLSCRARTAGAAAGRLLDVEDGGRIEPYGRRADVWQLAAAASAVAVQPGLRRPGGVANREGEVVVTRVGTRPDPGKLLGESLRGPAAWVPQAHHRAERCSEIEAAACAAPGGHGAERL